MLFVGHAFPRPENALRCHVKLVFGMQDCVESAVMCHVHTEYLERADENVI